MKLYPIYFRKHFDQLDSVRLSWWKVVELKKRKIVLGFELVELKMTSRMFQELKFRMLDGMKNYVGLGLLRRLVVWC